MNGAYPVDCRCCGKQAAAQYHGVSGVESHNCPHCGYSLEWSEDGGVIISEDIPAQYQETVFPRQNIDE